MLNGILKKIGMYNCKVNYPVENFFREILYDDYTKLLPILVLST